MSLEGHQSASQTEVSGLCVAFCRVVKETLAKTVRIIDGSNFECTEGWVDESVSLKIHHTSSQELIEGTSPECNQSVDLTFWVGKIHEFPLVKCLELIQRVCKTSGVVAFAAEPPIFLEKDNQTYLWPDQWAAHFADQGFTLVDLFREEWCRTTEIPESIAQNLVLFVDPSRVSMRAAWHNWIFPTAKRMVHPSRICRHQLIEESRRSEDKSTTMASFVLQMWEAQSPDQPSISSVITFHNEGYLAHRTLNGLALMCEEAEKRGLWVEVLCMLDNADERTRQVVSSHPLLGRIGRIFEVRHGDPGCGRNDAIDRAKGHYIAILDGDDLYSPNWFSAAYQRCKEFKLPVIVHPQEVVNFGHAKGMMATPDTSTLEREELSPLTDNRWVSTSFGPRLVYRLIPYTRAEVGRTGFGFEDWHWNCETFAAGILHVVAKRTALFYRQKAQSRVKQDNSRRAIIRPTAFTHGVILQDSST